MSKRKAYRPKPKSVPMLVTRELEKNVESVEGHTMVKAFQFGVATKDNYDYLVRMANMLNCAAQIKKLSTLQETIDAINFLARLIHERYERTGKFGVNADELTAMRDTVDFYQSLWQRQTTTLYNQCAAEMNAFYAEIAEKRAA